MFIKKLGFMMLAVCTLSVAAQGKDKYIHPSVTIVWDNPENYRDVDVSNGLQSRYRQQVLDNLERYLHKELPKYLTPQQRIKVTVFDLDLAGDVRPMVIPHSDVRIVTSMYPPMIELEYIVFDSQGGESKKSREKIRYMGFNIGSSLARSGKMLSYEKLMLKRWFAKALK